MAMHEACRTETAERIAQVVADGEKVGVHAEPVARGDQGRKQAFVRLGPIAAAMIRRYEAIMSAITFTSLANPGRFNAIARALTPWLAVITAGLFALGLYLGLFVAPEADLHGETYRIMYVHVPAAWLGMFVFATMAMAAIGTLVFRHPLADVAQKAAAPLGAGFTALCLITGSIWGRPAWGTWWEWRDARLTSMLILLLIYFGIIALWRAIDDQAKAAKAVAIVTLVGSLILPVIKFSVDWFSTLHQPASVMTLSGPKIHPSMLTPLLILGVAYLLLHITLMLVLMRAELMERRARRLALMGAYGAMA
jgi:heme exporter protein C